MSEIEAPGPLSDHFHVPVGFTIPANEEIDSLVLKAENLQTSLGALGDRVEAKIAERAVAFREELDAQTAGVSEQAHRENR